MFSAVGMVRLETCRSECIDEVLWCVGDGSSDECSGDEPTDEVNGDDHMEADVVSSDDDTEAVGQQQDSPMIE